MIAVLRDMAAGGCHRLGAVILAGTDSLVLSRFVGLTAAGLYANYALITSALKTLLLQMLGSGTASFGNARVELSREENHALYRRMLTVNLALSGLCSFCLYVLLNDFIRLWLGEEMILGEATVLVLCVQFFLDTGRIVTDSFVHGCGLFVKDRVRPFIEAAINLTVSIVLAMRYGVAGVFGGTIISFVLTAFWRAPLLLHRHVFGQGLRSYWRSYLECLALTVICAAIYRCMPIPTAADWLGWIGRGVLCAAGYSLAFLLVFGRSEECRFAFAWLRSRFSRM